MQFVLFLKRFFIKNIVFSILYLYRCEGKSAQSNIEASISTYSAPPPWTAPAKVELKKVYLKQHPKV